MSEQVTLFLCGPSSCEHDYSKYVPIIEDGREVGETLVCAKCGTTAYNASLWSD